jgi:hypothetical protein
VVGEKRKYKTDVNDAEVVKRIRQSEIELQDRNTVLRGSKPNVYSYLSCEVVLITELVLALEFQCDTCGIQRETEEASRDEQDWCLKFCVRSYHTWYVQGGLSTSINLVIFGNMLMNICIDAKVALRKSSK